MVITALRKIEAGLRAIADSPDEINHDDIRIAATRIGAQAEALEQDLQ